MRSAILFAILAAAGALAGCGQTRAEAGGPTVQRNYGVGPFERIEVAGPYDVNVRTGGNPTVSASGPEKLLEQMVVEVKGDRLVIRPRKDRRIFSWGRGGKAKVEVTAPQLRSAKIAGSGGIRIDRVRGESFEGAIAGSGDLDVDSLEVGDLKLAIAGSGELRARSGQARSASYKIAGSGDIDAGAIESETAEVSIAGSGNVSGRATGTADVSIMGSGDVVLTGGARCSISKAGSGNVRCS